MFKLKKTAAAKEQYAKREKPVSHFIPYKGHWDKNTILTKNNGLLQVIKVGGFSFETADDSDLDIRKNIRNSLLKNMASGNVTLYFHTIRRRKAVMQRNSEYSIDPTVKTSKDFISYLEESGRQKTLHLIHTSTSFMLASYMSQINKAQRLLNIYLPKFVKNLTKEHGKMTCARCMKVCKK